MFDFAGSVKRLTQQFQRTLPYDSHMIHYLFIVIVFLKITPKSVGLIGAEHLFLHTVKNAEQVAAEMGIITHIPRKHLWRLNLRHSTTNSNDKDDKDDDEQVSKGSMLNYDIGEQNPVFEGLTFSGDNLLPVNDDAVYRNNNVNHVEMILFQTFFLTSAVYTALNAVLGGAVANLMRFAGEKEGVKSTLKKLAGFHEDAKDVYRGDSRSTLSAMVSILVGQLYLRYMLFFSTPGWAYSIFSVRLGSDYLAQYDVFNVDGSTKTESFFITMPHLVTYGYFVIITHLYSGLMLIRHLRVWVRSSVC